MQLNTIKMAHEIITTKVYASQRNLYISIYICISIYIVYNKSMVIANFMMWKRQKCCAVNSTTSRGSKNVYLARKTLPHLMDWNFSQTFIYNHLCSSTTYSHDIFLIICFTLGFKTDRNI